MNNIINFINAQKIKMLLIIVLTFLAVKYVSPQVFIANTPTVNPLFVANIMNTPSYIASIPQKITQKISNMLIIRTTQSEIAKVTIKNPPSGLIFKPLQGVSAQVAEDPATGKKYLNMPAGTKYKFEEIELNGKTVKVIRILKN